MWVDSSLWTAVELCLVAADARRLFEEPLDLAKEPLLSCPLGHSVSWLHEQALNHHPFIRQIRSNEMTDTSVAPPQVGGRTEWARSRQGIEARIRLIPVTRTRHLTPHSVNTRSDVDLVGIGLPAPAAEQLLP